MAVRPGAAGAPRLLMATDESAIRTQRANIKKFAERKEILSLLEERGIPRSQGEAFAKEAEAKGLKRPDIIEQLKAGASIGDILDGKPAAASTAAANTAAANSDVETTAAAESDDNATTQAGSDKAATGNTETGNNQDMLAVAALLLIAMMGMQQMAGPMAQNPYGSFGGNSLGAGLSGSAGLNSLGLGSAGGLGGNFQDQALMASILAGQQQPGLGSGFGLSAGGLYGGLFG